MSQKNNSGKTQHFTLSAKLNFTTGKRRATNLPPFDVSFTYIGITQKNQVVQTCSLVWKKWGNIHFIMFVFYYNCFSIFTKDSLKSMDRVSTHFSIIGQWQTKCTIAKKINYSSTSKEWTIIILDFSWNKSWY